LSKKENGQSTTKELTIAPVDLSLNVDQEFADFCLKRLQEFEVKKGKIVTVVILGHIIRFRVKKCKPKNSKIGPETKLNIMKFDTRSNMVLKETEINIFMTDEKAKKVISDLLVDEVITEKNAIKLWNEFKKRQISLISQQ